MTKTPSPEDMRLAIWMLDKVKRNFPRIRVKIDHWAEEIRKLRQLDKRTHKEIAILWKWATSHQGKKGFGWKRNLRSVAKLRKRVDKDDITYYELIEGQMIEDRDRENYQPTFTDRQLSVNRDIYDWNRARDF